MGRMDKVEMYYKEEHRFKSAVWVLRDLALKTGLEETFKWNLPTYAIDGKNVLSICKFKNHFGIWFFKGAFLKDSKKKLENAQEGKTQNMRHWKFTTESEIEAEEVYRYMVEAIAIQKKGIPAKSAPRTKTSNFEVPELLKNALLTDLKLKQTFHELTPYKQREYAEYIAGAKREATKHTRLAKILPMIKQGLGLNDAYR